MSVWCTYLALEESWMERDNDICSQIVFTGTNLIVDEMEGVLG